MYYLDQPFDNLETSSDSDIKAAEPCGEMRNTYLKGKLARVCLHVAAEIGGAFDFEMKAVTTALDDLIKQVNV